MSYINLQNDATVNTEILKSTYDVWYTHLSNEATADTETLKSTHNLWDTLTYQMKPQWIVKL